MQSIFIWTMKIDQTARKHRLTPSLCWARVRRYVFQIVTPLFLISPWKYILYVYALTGSVGIVHFWDLEVAGLIPGRVIPKILKTVLAALSLSVQH